MVLSRMLVVDSCAFNRAIKIAGQAEARPEFSAPAIKGCKNVRGSSNASLKVLWLMPYSLWYLPALATEHVRLCVRPRQAAKHFVPHSTQCRDLSRPAGPHFKAWLGPQSDHFILFY